MASAYDRDQSHICEDNSARVWAKLSHYASRYGNSALLDVGCGTGFILRLAKGKFKRLVGVDITPAMIEKARAIGGVDVYDADSVKMPFVDGEFDVAVAYGFLHHLDDVLPTLREVNRCLKKGGLFYADQDPNYYCWLALRNIKDGSAQLGAEIKTLKDTVGVLEQRYGLTADVVKMAEYNKFYANGFRENKLWAMLREAGFSNIVFDYQWYLGQGKVDREIGDRFANVLRGLLPLSRSLFKYLSFEAIK